MVLFQGDHTPGGPIGNFGLIKIEDLAASYKAVVQDFASYIGTAPTDVTGGLLPKPTGVEAPAPATMLCFIPLLGKDICTELHAGLYQNFLRDKALHKPHFGIS